MDLPIISLILLGCICNCFGSEILGCGGFVKSDVDIQYSRVELKLYSKQGSLKYETDCAPNNGYYFIPLYDKGDYTLKVEPPPGWSFEPTSVTLRVDGTNDACSQGQDINFQFIGFSVSGRVISKGSDNGPPGVQIILKKSSGEFVQETTTAQNGLYSFKNILPGDYKLFASHSMWKFEQNSIHLKVTNDNGKVNNDFQVKGYDVTGEVRSDGEPIRGVNFLLFSKISRVFEGCNTIVVKGFNLPSNLRNDYLCHVTSGQDGKFMFPSLGIGVYQLLPFYKGEHIEFDVSPGSMEFTVGHGSVILKEHFMVQGFSVSGRVLMNSGGSGINNAKILLNGKEQAITYQNGIYHFENMKTGTYNLEVVAEHFYFEPSLVKITPNTPQLPDMIASRYDICGRFSILSDSDFSVSQRIVKLYDARKVEIKSLVTNEAGSFCSDFQKGEYTLAPEVSEDEDNAGLQFTPAEIHVTIKDKPVLSVVFAQFSAKVKGTVNCIEKCDVQLRLDPSRRNGEGFEILDVSIGNFEISDLLPGSYQLMILKPNWCWKKTTILFTVTNKDITGLTFEHTGYSVSITSTHETELNVVAPKGEIFRVKVLPGTNSECLPLPGVYDLQPIGCHVFQEDSFKFSTSSPNPISLIAVKHTISGLINAAENTTDLQILISKQWNGGEETEIIKLANSDLKGTQYVFPFSVSVHSHSSLVIKPMSKKLLFYPPTTTLQVEDKCLKNIATFTGKLGLFILGKIVPPLGGVMIKVFSKKNLKEELASVESDPTGKYVIGPLDEDTSYDVTAEREGYNFEKMNEIGHFQAFKLAEVIVKVENENKEALPGVLVSLSGGADYRKNSITQNEGQLQFIGLGPGEYFLRPVMKEYQFNPPSKIIKVSEGLTLNVTISGSRVAFSCFGVINSLTGEAEPALTIEARGIGSDHCKQFQEETSSESDGTFRIRGLQPDCQYSVHIKTGAEENQHVERVSPKQRVIKVSGGDVKNIRLIVFRHFSQMDISGYVATSQEFLSTLKVRLFREDSPDQALHTLSLGQSSFFHLPVLPLDNRSYILRLDSSLPSGSYHMVLPSVNFKANLTYRHFNLEFKPRPRLADQEMIQGSLLVLPLIIVISILIFNYSKVLPLFGQAAELLQSVINPARVSGSVEPMNVENISRRRVKPKKI